jgi:putative restriction endonuclease
MIDLAAKLQHLISKIVTWKKGEKRAPHKPLLLLLALGNLQRGGKRLQPFAEIVDPLTRAMEIFGPAGRVPTPQYPFWRLKNDELWDFEADGSLRIRKSSDDPTKSALIEKRARAGFLAVYHDLLRRDKTLQARIIHQILDAHFPPSIHEDIAAYFGLSVGEPETADHVSTQQFRNDILAAYHSRCAVTHFFVNLGSEALGVEPAHICWPQAGGLNAVANGIALSTLHRKLFHLGVFTIDFDYRVVVSPHASGELGFSGMLERFHGQKILLPTRVKDLPSKRCLEWHASEVFRS